MTEKEKREAARETLNAISTTIKNSDDKAVALLTAAGVLFGLSIFSLDSLKGKTNDAQNVMINVFGISYLMLFVSLITLLVMTIFPRRKALMDAKMRELSYKNYGEDVQRAIDDHRLGELLYKEPSLMVLEDQIVKCSLISRKKEMCLRASSFILVAVTLCLAALVVLGSIK